MSQQTKTDTFINKLYSRLTLANDYFRNCFTIISKYFYMIICYLKWETPSGPISLDKRIYIILVKFGWKSKFWQSFEILVEIKSKFWQSFEILVEIESNSKRNRNNSVAPVIPTCRIFNHHKFLMRSAHCTAQDKNHLETSHLINSFGFYMSSILHNDDFSFSQMNFVSTYSSNNFCLFFILDSLDSSGHRGDLRKTSRK